MSDPLLSNESSRSKTPTPQVGRTPTPTPASRESTALKTRARTQGFAEAERDRVPAENKQPGEPPATKVSKASDRGKAKASPKGGTHARPPAAKQVFDFEEGSEIAVEREEVATDAHGDAQIRGFAAKMSDALLLLGQNYKAALDSFGDGMTADLGPDTALSMSGVLRSILGDAISGLVDLGIGSIASPAVAFVLKSARAALTSSLTAPTTGSAKLEITTFVRRSVESALGAITRATVDVHLSVGALSARLSKIDDLASRKGFLEGLNAMAAGALQRVPYPDAIRRQVVAAWVTGPGARTPAESKDKPNGRIVIESETKGDESAYRFEVTSVHLDVAALAGNAAKLVRESISEQGLFGAGIPVDLMVSLPNNVPGGWTRHRIPMTERGVPTRAPALLPNGKACLSAIMNDGAFWSSAAAEGSQIQGGK